MYADGSRYTGSWYRNKKHGPAVFMSDNGRTFEGLFEDDAMTGKMQQVVENLRGLHCMRARLESGGLCCSTRPRKVKFGEDVPQGILN